MSIQQQAIDFVRDLLILDKRVKAMFLKGSLARGEGDDVSDVDFYCIVDELDLETFLREQKSILEQYKTLVYYSEVYFVAPQIVCIFDNGLHFDLYTLTKGPTEGTDMIKVLYDPQGMLDNYQVTKNIVDHAEIAEYMNDFAYTLIEVEAAYKRNDFLWATRLGGHLIMYLSSVLCYLYNKEALFIGMKRLSSKLPDDIRIKLMEANNQLTEKDFLYAIKGLIELQEIILMKLDQDILDHININFLTFMKKRIYDIDIKTESIN